MERYVYIIAPVAGWVVAQSLKVIFELRKDGVHIKDAFESGGMPSTHTAGITALTTVIGLQEGIDSAIFGLSFVMNGIIIYDAIGVRRATGENTLAIRELAKRLHLGARMHVMLAKGHTPFQVLAGAGVGVVVGLLTHNLIK